MDDTISRKAALDALGDEPEVWTDKDEYAQGLNNQWHYDRNAIKALPTVDAVPVVRCKDCKHNPKLEWLGCPMASLNEKQRPETAWCWKGEQKDGEANENR